MYEAPRFFAFVFVGDSPFKLMKNSLLFWCIYWYLFIDKITYIETNLYVGLCSMRQKER